MDLHTQVRAFKHQLVERALETTRGNRRQAAQLLGISLRTLFYIRHHAPPSRVPVDDIAVTRLAQSSLRPDLKALAIGIVRGPA
jgi:hypothetical protein